MRAEAGEASIITLHSALPLTHFWPVNASLPASPSAPKETSPSAKFVRFLRITSLAAVRRAQRHVPDSITTIRYQLSFALIKRLGQQTPRSVSLLRATKRKADLVTQ